MQFYRTIFIIHTNWGDGKQFQSLNLIKFDSEISKGTGFFFFFFSARAIRWQDSLIHARVYVSDLFLFYHVLLFSDISFWIDLSDPLCYSIYSNVSHLGQGKNNFSLVYEAITDMRTPPSLLHGLSHNYKNIINLSCERK